MESNTTVGTQLIPFEKKERLEKALEWCESLREITIDNQEQYDNAVDLCKQVKTGINSLESDRKELVKPYKDKTSKIDAEYREVRTDLQNAEKVIKDGMNKFWRQQEMKRIEEQKKREAEAEKERKKAEEKAEAERLKAEAYREQGREDMAAKAEARAETAETVSSSIAPVAVENTAKTSGVSYRTVYKVTVINHSRAIEALAKNEMFHQFLEVDVKGLEKMVNSSKGKLKLPEGLLVTEETISSVRT